jgi:pSer/pThr/pTyr-binding forkhead associated (FHA) protein
MADGSEFEASCRVSKQAINLVIGRSHADLMIDSPAVSRHHASLNGTAESLTISDLGSSNGTSINGVPCLEGETMFISEGDSIILGNVRFSYEILPDSTSGRREQE